MPFKPTGFIGFPDVKMKPTIIPDVFFTELLPLVDDLAELKLTLHCFWLLNEQEGALEISARGGVAHGRDPAPQPQPGQRPAHPAADPGGCA